MSNSNISLIHLILILLLAGISNAQTIHDVTVTNFSFIPEVLNITVGDTVRWTNVLGNHNVVADDNSFTSGPVAPPTWEYTYVFTTNGNNPYYCELHGGPGGVGMSGVINVLPSTTFALSVSVADGWNMVSVPGTNPAGMGVTDWWSGKDPAADVFKYSAGYSPVTTTTPTEGYWLKNVGTQVYNYGAIQIVPHNNVPLAEGWNLIGLYEITEPTATLTTSPPGIITANIFEYSGGYNPAANIVPGYGYWVKSDVVGGSIVPLSAPPLSKDGGEVVEYFKEDWGKIIITDNAGVSYTLYAVKGEVDLDKYELPPAPPAGMFDIRYSSGRIAEDINSSIQTIEMSSLAYPITVSVEGMDIRLQDESGKDINENVKSGDQITISNSQINKLMVSGELIPDVYALEQNYPNPFNPSTVIEFSLPEDVNNVALTIYDILGQKVTQLVNTSLKAGKYKYQWNAGTVATGMYIYALRTDNFVSVKKMVLMK